MNGAEIIINIMYFILLSTGAAQSMLINLTNNIRGWDIKFKFEQKRYEIFIRVN